MITSKAKLIENVYKWLIRDQTTDNFINQDLVETYIQLAEAELSRELKIIECEDTAAFTLNTTDNFITLPDNFRGVLSLEFDSRPFDITWFPTRQAMKDKCAIDVGRPHGYFIFGNKIIFNCVPDSAYTMTMDYYKGVVALVAQGDTNVILTKFPDAYLYGSVRQAIINLNIKDRLQDVASLYSDAINRIKEADKDSRMPTGARGYVHNVMGG